MADNEISLARKKAAELYKPMNTRIKEGPGLAGGWDANGPIGHVADSLSPTNFNANAAQTAGALPPMPMAARSLRKTDPTPVWSTDAQPAAASAPDIAPTEQIRADNLSLRQSAPATAVEQRNAAYGGVSVPDQRGAIDVSGAGIRNASTPTLFADRGVATAEGVLNGSLRRAPTGAVAEADRVMAQAGEGPGNLTFNLGNYGGNATIYGQSTDGKRVNSFTGTGEGSSGFENSQQHKDAVVRAAADKVQLAQIEDGKKEQELINNLRSAPIGGRKGAGKALDNYYRQGEVDKTIEANTSLRRAQTMADLRKAQVEQLNKDRDYQRNVANDQFDQNKNLAERRDKSTAEFTKQLEGRFVGADGKPDAARVSDAMSKVQEELATQIQALQAVPKEHADHSKAQQLAKALSERGLDALDASDRDKLMTRLEYRERALQQHGILPGKATFVDGPLSSFDIVGQNENVFGSPTLRSANGTELRAADAAYTEPANALLLDVGKVRTTRFNSLRRN